MISYLNFILANVYCNIDIFLAFWYVHSEHWRFIEKHLLYNVVMDRSHNGKIVQRQAEDLNLSAHDRDPDYLHFIK